jgi:hypothetical protein
VKLNRHHGIQLKGVDFLHVPPGQEWGWQQYVVQFAVAIAEAGITGLQWSELTGVGEYLSADPQELVFNALHRHNLMAAAPSLQEEGDLTDRCISGCFRFFSLPDSSPDGAMTFSSPRGLS